MTSWRFCEKTLRSIVTAVVLGGIAAPAAFAVPTLSITAAPASPLANSTVTLSIAAADVTDLYGYQFSLAFDPKILQANSVVEDAYLASGGSTFFYGGTIDNVAGTITGAFNALTGALSGVSGGGILEKIEFNTLGSGSTALTFSDVQFVDSTFTPMTVQAANRTLVVGSAVSAVPEASTCALMALGLATLAAMRRRRAL